VPDVDGVHLGAGDRCLGSVSAIGRTREQGLDETEAFARATVRSAYLNEDIFKRYLSSRRLGRRTVGSYGTALRSFNNLVGIPLEEAEWQDLEEWFRRVSLRGLKASTIHLYASRLRKLLEYAVRGRGLSRSEARARVESVMEGVPMVDLRREARRRTPGRDKLVAPEELGALMRTARHPRTRALVAVLYDSGCRKAELIDLRIRDVRAYENHVELLVLGKTGERTIPLVRSIKHLERWLKVHPDPRPGAPLFATVWRGDVRRMDERSPNRLLKDLCARAGLRRVTPHMLRHTRLTELAAAGVGEYTLKNFAGWTMDSDMAARYIHLSGRAHIPSILSLQGIVLEEAEA